MATLITREAEQAFLKNQREACKANGWPFFMPYDGLCRSCGRDIIKALIEKGHDGTALVTGCPLCNQSYCE